MNDEDGTSSAGLISSDCIEITASAEESGANETATQLQLNDAMDVDTNENLLNDEAEAVAESGSNEMEEPSVTDVDSMNNISDAADSSAVEADIEVNLQTVEVAGDEPVNETDASTIEEDTLALSTIAAEDAKLESEPVEQDSVSSAVVDIEMTTGVVDCLANTLDEDEEEEGRHHRFLRTNTEEKPVMCDARQRITRSRKLRMESATQKESSTATASSSPVVAVSASLVVRNLPSDHTAQQIKDLLQEKLPAGVELHELNEVQDGRAQVNVTPASAAEEAAQLLHDTQLGDKKISVRKLITAETTNSASDSPVKSEAKSAASTAQSGSHEASQNVCSLETCSQLVGRGDQHPMCSLHSACFQGGKFDPSSCSHCLAQHASAVAGDLLARRLWTNRVRRVRKKRMSWASPEIMHKFNRDFPYSKIVANPIKEDADNVSSSDKIPVKVEDKVEEQAASQEEKQTGDAVADVEVKDADALSKERDLLARGRRAAEQHLDASDKDEPRDRSPNRSTDTAAKEETAATDDTVTTPVSDELKALLKTKQDIQTCSKGPAYRVFIGNIANIDKVNVVGKLIQDIVGGLTFLVEMRGSLLAEFQTVELANRCMKEMNQMMINGKNITVKEDRFSNSKYKSGAVGTNKPVNGSTGEVPVKTKSTEISSELNARLQSMAQGGAGGKTKPSTGPPAKISSQLLSRLSTDTVKNEGAAFIGPVVPSTTSVKDRLHKPAASATNANSFGFSPEVLKSLNISLPIVKEVFVSNLSPSVTEADVRELMSVAGVVKSVQHNKALGHAVVEMSHPVDAVQAISLLHTQFYFDKALEVRQHRTVQALGPSAPAPVIPRGLQTIGTRLQVDKKAAAAAAAATAPITAVGKQNTKDGARGRVSNWSKPTVGVQGQQQPAQQRGGASSFSGSSSSFSGGASSFSGGPSSYSDGPPSFSGGVAASRQRRGGMRPGGRSDDYDLDDNRNKRKNPYWNDYKGPRGNMNQNRNNSMNSSSNSINSNYGPNGNNYSSTNYSKTNFSTNYSGGFGTGGVSNYGNMNAYYGGNSTNDQATSYGNGSTSNSMNYSGAAAAANSGTDYGSSSQYHSGTTAAASNTTLAASGGGGTADSTKAADNSGGWNSSGNWSNYSSSGHSTGNWTNYSGTSNTAGSAAAGHWLGSTAAAAATATGSSAATSSYGWQQQGTTDNSSNSAAGYNSAMYATPPAAATGSADAIGYAAVNPNYGYGNSSAGASYSSGYDGGWGSKLSGSSTAAAGGGGYDTSTGAAGDSQHTSAKQWEAQTTAKVPKYNADGSFAGFSFST